MPVLVRDQVDCQTEVSETSGAADAVKVGLGIFGEVEVDHHINRLDVNTTGEEVCPNQETTQ